MTQERFEELLDELDGTSLNTLKTKNAKYAPSDDALHNFHVGAQIMGCTTAQCAWGYATKHITALRDKIVRDDWSDRDDVLEKIQDTINYLRFIWCAANEQLDDDKATRKCINVENITNDGDCSTCIHWGKAPFDYVTGKIMVESCFSCRHNISPHEANYDTYKSNWEHE